MAKKPKRTRSADANEPTIENRRARRDYLIDETLECGIKLTGTEIKSIRAGKISLTEGYARAIEDPVSLSLYAVHIAEYPPAGPNRQHPPIRTRTLLAQKREIRRLARSVKERSGTLIPLKVYFVRGRAKVLLGVAVGRRKADKRRKLDAKEARKDIDRAMRRKV